jgi:uncharacterized iron-regulated membrane protein
MRRRLYRLHWYLGLPAGAVFVLPELTGSPLMRHHAIDAPLSPAELTARSDRPPRPLGKMPQAVARAQPHDPPPFRIFTPCLAASIVEILPATAVSRTRAAPA